MKLELQMLTSQPRTWGQKCEINTRWYVNDALQGRDCLLHETALFMYTYCQLYRERDMYDS